MKNPARDFWLMLPLAALVLTGAALLRGAEYDEQYTLFLTAGTPRPVWPDGVFPAGLVAARQHGVAMPGAMGVAMPGAMGVATPGAIAAALRRTDVHPPLYFWAIALWRWAFGPGLVAARGFSVLCGTLSVGLTGLLARRAGVRPGVAMLVLLGCYGFVYTSCVARGFALAEVLLLGGTLLVSRRRVLPGGVRGNAWPRGVSGGVSGGVLGGVWLGGVLLGAACASNYLAVFVALTVVAVMGAWRAIVAMAPFLALDAWFFVAQHGSRPDQFPPFSGAAALIRLAGYQAGAVFGGLPLYADGFGRQLAGALVGLTGAAALARIRLLPDWRLVAVVAATPVGLLLLGAVFDTTPIELRYLSFGLPFLAVLLARQGLSRPLCLMLAVQVAGVAGLMLAPRTMQPARTAAREAAALAGGGVVVVPRGNDGVGIVGAFGIEAPSDMMLTLARFSDTPEAIAARVAEYRRVVLALMAQDADSRHALAMMRAAFAGPGWRCVAIGSTVAVYERTDAGG